jgi:hypothetical protein
MKTKVAIQKIAFNFPKSLTNNGSYSRASGGLSKLGYANSNSRLASSLCFNGLSKGLAGRCSGIVASDFPSIRTSRSLKISNFRSISTGSKDISEPEVRALFNLWNNALATGDSRIVAKRYAKESILLPTVSNVPRTDFDSIKDYFDAFLLKQPQGQILEGDVRIGEGWAQDAGVYEFTMGGKF